MAKKKKKRTRGLAGLPRKAADIWRRMPVQSGWLAFFLINLAVLMAGAESAYVQTITTYRSFSWDLLTKQSFWLLFSLDLLLPLTVALLSRRAFLVYLLGQTFLSTILLHYTIFFYNPLTLASIYHSAQGAASLGVDIFGFARPDIILIMGALFLFKVALVRMSWLPDARMPLFWHKRGVTAVTCIAVIWLVSNYIYGKTGLSPLWVDSRGARTETQRRLEEGTREAVRNIGYIGTWVGEWLSGTYQDTALIYAETRCFDPDKALCNGEDIDRWAGLPLPPESYTVVMIQVESLDYAALGMTVNGHMVMPFLSLLSEDSLLLKTFAPHKVGSSNSDYEILNARVADQNVIYYSYIRNYPDSVVRRLHDRGYETSLFHGLPGYLFNLREAYADMGFENLYFKEELLDAGYGPSDYIMEHVKDEDVFDMAISQLFRTKAAAAPSRHMQFIITMSSHIPFIRPMPIFESAGGSFARYASSLRYADQCLAAYYAQLPEGTLLFIWGDHGSDVTYPRGFPDNERHVPFIAHVKGNSTWLNTLPLRNMEDTMPLVGQKEDGQKPDMEQIAARIKPGERRLSSPRVFALCELGYYLRRALR